MRRPSSAIFAAAALLSIVSASSAIAKTIYLGNQPYDGLGTIDASYTPTETGGYYVGSQGAPRSIYEHAFFTPVADFQQAGYQCSGTVSVSFVRGVRHLHRGTYCIR